MYQESKKESKPWQEKLTWKKNSWGGHQEKQNGSNWNRNQPVKNNWQGGSGGGFARQQQQQPSPPRDSNAMDVDRMCWQGQRGGERPTCYKCGKVGHIARVCRSGGEQQVRQMTGNWQNNPWQTNNPFCQHQEPSDIQQMDADLYKKICKQVIDEEIAKMAGRKESDCSEEERRKMDFLMSRQ